jgi:hypothetical protein
MALELIAAFVAAVAFAGIAHLLRRMSKQRLPSWIVPFAAGLGLIGFTVWGEYNWFSRVSATLPPGVVVVHAEPQSTPFRPWSYVFPLRTQFVAMDTTATIPHPEAASMRLVSLYSFVRWGGRPNVALMVVDCDGARQVMLTEGIAFTPDGQMTGGDWVSLGADDAIQMAACVEV